ncbi:unnamed protein product [Vicia faba]|uniref:Uncharacterized protein n=1 Tax=Vicia faba TaxID=3906 RepID=A0AAV1BC66_VICFA|nr:unnamed protein product [Vicia faba]
MTYYRTNTRTELTRPLTRESPRLSASLDCPPSPSHQTIVILMTITFNVCHHRPSKILRRHLPDSNTTTDHSQPTRWTVALWLWHCDILHRTTAPAILAQSILLHQNSQILKIYFPISISLCVVILSQTSMVT